MGQLGGVADFGTIVEHGAVAATARPTVTGPVVWVGTVTPDNWQDGDILANPNEASTLTLPVELVYAISDETTALTTGTGKMTVRAPCAFTLTEVRASLTTSSSSGLPTFDVNINGTTSLSTKLTVDVSEKTSTTAATPAVISVSTVADDDEITFDVDVAGTGAAGAKITLIGTRT